MNPTNSKMVEKFGALVPKEVPLSMASRIDYEKLLQDYVGEKEYSLSDINIALEKVRKAMRDLRRMADDVAAAQNRHR